MTLLFRNIIKNSRIRLPDVQEAQSNLRHFHRTEKRGTGYGAQRRQCRRLLTHITKPPTSVCCGQGCNPCALDIYEQQLKRYCSNNNKCRCTYVPPPEICMNNCLSPTIYTAFKLTHVKKDVKDTYMYTFKFWNKYDDPSAQNCRLIIKPGQYCFMQGDTYDDKGKLMSRPYAVFLNEKDKMSFDVVIQLCPKGPMSEYISDFQIGDIVHWRGPFGDFDLSYDWGHILMIGHGTGITPLYGVICDVLEHYKCDTRLRLFHCCHDHNNINLRYKLHDLATFWNFECDIFLGNDPNKYFTRLHHERAHARKLKESDIKQYFEEIKSYENKTYRVLLCGGNVFIDAVKKYLSRCGVKNDLIHRF